MQQGLRAPPINKAEVRQMIIKIDRISFTIFEKTNYFGPEQDSLNISLLNRSV